MIGAAAPDIPLRSRLLWLIGLRVVMITVLLGSGVLTQVRTPGAWPINPFFFVLGLTYALTVVYAVTLRFVERQRWLVDLQLGLDAFIISALVLMTGGVQSYFQTLYALPIVGASILQYRRGGLLVGVLSTVMYGGLVLAQYSWTFGFVDVAGLPVTALPPVRNALFTVGLDAVGFMGVAFLSGYLAERLRRADARLAHASTQIADLQAFNQHVIESLTSGLATTDPDGRVLTFNQTARAITGRGVSEAVGQLIYELLQLPAAFVDAVQSRSKHSYRTEVTYTTPAGRQIDIGLSASPLNVPGGQGGLLFVFQDVTETRRMERVARLQQRLAAVGEMAAGIAHEIRNPLASMSGSIQILRHDLPLNSEQEQLMDIVLRESERLNETIKTFLAYARPQRFATKQLDLRRVINDAALLLRHGSEAGEQHQVDVSAPQDPVWYEADENQIRQIVWNLATNGLRAMPEGGRLVLAVATAGDGEVMLSVSDEGVGIPADELDRVLQPFHASFGKGTGLGLAIVHRIVSDYDGELQITSKEGSGTTVAIRLPTRPSGASTSERGAATVASPGM